MLNNEKAINNCFFILIDLKMFVVNLLEYIKIAI